MSRTAASSPTRGPATTGSPLGTSLANRLRSVSARPLPTRGRMGHSHESGAPGAAVPALADVRDALEDLIRHGSVS